MVSAAMRALPLALLTALAPLPAAVQAQAVGAAEARTERGKAKAVGSQLDRQAVARLHGHAHRADGRKRHEHDADRNDRLRAGNAARPVGGACS